MCLTNNVYLLLYVPITTFLCGSDHVYEQESWLMGGKNKLHETRKVKACPGKE